MHLGIIEYYAAFRSSDRTLKSIVAGLVVAGDAYLIADRLRLLLSGTYILPKIRLFLVFLHVIVQKIMFLSS